MESVLDIKTELVEVHDLKSEAVMGFFMSHTYAEPSEIYPQLGDCSPGWHRG